MRIKESVINSRYKSAKDQIIADRPARCECCETYQGSDDCVLSFSHVISRADCKKYDLLELIYDSENIRLHCMNFGNRKGCHEHWENGTQTGSDTDGNLEYVRIISEKNNVPELYQRYLNKFNRNA